jgi:hypothetical protein
VKKIKKLNTALLTVLSLIIISGVMFGSASFASSASSVNTVNKSTASEIPKSVLRQARISAEESILGLQTEAQLRQILHSHDLAGTLKNENLTPKDFREEVRNEMITYLTTQGYSQTQITAALDSKYMRSHKHNI